MFISCAGIFPPGARCTAALKEVLGDPPWHSRNGGDVKKYVAMAKDRNSGFKRLGFGHRVYKNFICVKIIKAAADKALSELGFFAMLEQRVVLAQLRRAPCWPRP